MVDDQLNGIFLHAILYLSEVVKARVHAIDADIMEVTLSDYMTLQELLK